MPSVKIIILLILLSLVLVWRTWNFYDARPVYHDGERIRLVATVREEPQITTGKQKIKIKTADGFRVTVVTHVSPMYEDGQEIIVDGVFTKKHGEDFDYWTVYFPHLQTVKNDHNIVTDAAYAVKNEAKNLFQSTLPPVSSSLLLGMVLGGKQGMPEDFLEKLRTTGVLHVIAASGMNVSFVAMMLVAGLGKFMKRQVALFTAVFGIAFYVTVAGFEPSIVRAAIMSSLAIVATLLGRQSAGVVTLFLTGYIMLLVSPVLWEDVGFQLSFLATLGILVVKPLLDGGLDGLGSLGRLGGEDVSTTTAAQVATLPVMLGVFGSYGLLSILVNALVLWTVPVLMILGTLAIILGGFFEPLGKLPLFISYPFLWYFEAVINIFGGTGWMVTVPEVSWVVWVGYYLLLAAVVFRKRKANQKL